MQMPISTQDVAHMFYILDSVTSQVEVIQRHSNYHVTFVRERGRIDVDLVVGLDSGILSGCSVTESGDSRELCSSAVHS